MIFFQTHVNVFRHVEKNTYYKKQYSYVCSEKTIFVLNANIIDFPKYKHEEWLNNSEKKSECFVCNKCQYRVFHLKYGHNKHYREIDRKIKDKQVLLLHDERIINPYFT
jgi:hypothetical protein